MKIESTIREFRKFKGCGCGNMNRFVKAVIVGFARGGCHRRKRQLRHPQEIPGLQGRQEKGRPASGADRLLRPGDGKDHGRPLHRTRRPDPQLRRPRLKGGRKMNRRQAKKCIKHADKLALISLEIAERYLARKGVRMA